MKRRRFLQLTSASALVATAGFPKLALAAPAIDGRFVVIVLRGGMDGLSVVPAYGDPSYERARNGIAIPPPGADGGALPLDGTFGLNPRLVHLAEMYKDGSLMPIQACCVAYHGRSHFDAQNVLENGSAIPYGLKTGWLNRALATLPARDGDLAIAIDQTMPVILTGPSKVTSWYPSQLPQPDGDTIDRIATLYEQDAKLAEALAAARRVHGDANATGGSGFAALMTAAGRFLAPANGPSIAMLESTGWDTHANQAPAFGALQRNLGELDAGIQALRDSLGDTWSRTAVLVMTEFGRTVAMNGTRGTDHGTGGAAFLVGGAVAGGRVLTDWPGLRPNDLLEGRDLRPTTDLRAVMKAALVDHLRVAEADVETQVFPDSRGVAPIAGLFRRTV